MDNQILNQDNNNDGNSRKKIKLDDGNDTDGNIRDINITFYRVWRNIVIRNEILFHTRLFNIHFGRTIAFTLEGLLTYKYRGYLDRVLIYPQGYKINGETPLLPNVIPYGVSKVEFIFGGLILYVNSIPNTVTTVSFRTSTKQEFAKGMLPDSITNLVFGSPFNQSLAGEWLPSSLKSLSLAGEFQQDIGVNQLPKSLTELNFNSYSDYKGKIAPGSIPSTVVKPLSYTWECECEKELTDQESSNIQISNIKYGISQCIKEGDIPHNAISIKFSDLFKGGEILGALPASLKSLEFGYSQNVPTIANVLPSSNLTSIDMGGYNLPLVSNLFPQSITSITFRGFNKPIPEGHFYNYTNLKSLIFSIFNQVIPKKIFPPSLTSLELGCFNQAITENIFPPSLLTLTLGNNFYHAITERTLPTSLTSLTLSSYHYPLKKNVLPASLQTLKLGYFNHKLKSNVLPPSLSTLEIESSRFKLGIGQLPSSITSLSIGTRRSHKYCSIPVGSLPCNLKVLYINYPNFNQDLTEEGILPNSIQSIYFNFRIERNFINNLNVDFFKKYIRFR